MIINQCKFFNKKHKLSVVLSFTNVLSAAWTSGTVRIFQRMFASVLKDRFGQAAFTHGTNPFLGFLSIRHNQTFELMSAVRAFDEIDRHLFSLFFSRDRLPNSWFVYSFQHAVPKRNGN